MSRGPEDVILDATAGCIVLATGAAIALIVYAMVSFVGLLPASSAQDLVRLAR